MASNSPPAAPDPAQVASAQTGENISTAIANSQLSHVNQTNAYGDTTNYNQIGSSAYTDPVSGKTYQIPQYSQTTQLSAPQQRLYNTVQGAQQGAANTAQGLIGQAQQRLSSPLDLGQYMTNAGSYQPHLGQFNTSGTANNINLSPYNTSGTVNNVNLSPYNTSGTANNIDLSKFNVNPDTINQYTNKNWQQPFKDTWDQKQNNLNQQLADQGLTTGSEAWNNAQRNFGQELQNSQDQYSSAMYGNAINAALGSAAQNAANTTGQAATNFGQQLAANSQGASNTLNQANTNFGQSLSANAQNAANATTQAGTNFGQQLAANSQGATNALNQSQFGFNSNLAANGANAGMATQMQNQPINELSGLLSNSQISSPNFGQVSQTNIPTTDYANIANQGYANQMQQYQAQQKQNAAMYGGLFGLGGTLLSGGLFG